MSHLAAALPLYRLESRPHVVFVAGTPQELLNYIIKPIQVAADGAGMRHVPPSQKLLQPREVSLYMVRLSVIL